MNGLVLFCQQPAALAEFYAAVLPATRVDTDDLVRLVHDGTELLLLGQNGIVDDDGAPRSAAAMKPVFTVADASALHRVAAHGGVVTDREFQFAGYRCCDVIDPEGNVLQLRLATE